VHNASMGGVLRKFGVARSSGATKEVPGCANAFCMWTEEQLRTAATK